jgi:hypothetical protein
VPATDSVSCRYGFRPLGKAEGNLQEALLNDARRVTITPRTERMGDDP